MSDPPFTIGDMGEVVSFERFRRARALASEATPPIDPVERLSAAVRRLETTLREVRDLDEPNLRRELVALNGAVAVGRYRMAADRTERLVERLLERSG